jgi:hypothetical protein
MRALAARVAEGAGCARDASEFAEVARRAAHLAPRPFGEDDGEVPAAVPVEAAAEAPVARSAGAAGRTYARPQQSAMSRRRQARARTTHARRTRRRIVRACASRGLRAVLRTEGWGAPREGRITLATYNVSGRFGRGSWRPLEDGLPARIQNMIAVLTHTDGDNSGACGLQHRSEGNKRTAAGGGVRIIHSDLFAARRVDIATLARDAGVGEFKDIVAVTLTLGRTTITVIGIYIPPRRSGVRGLAAAAAWRDGTASIGCVINAVRSGLLGDDAMGGHIVVGGDLNMHLGTGDDAVFAGWVSEDARRCERGVQFAALCEQWRIRPVNDWNARARTTYTHGTSTRSVLDYHHHG